MPNPFPGLNHEPMRHRRFDPSLAAFTGQVTRRLERMRGPRSWLIRPFVYLVALGRGRARDDRIGLPPPVPGAGPARGNLHAWGTRIASCAERSRAPRSNVSRQQKFRGPFDRRYLRHAEEQASCIRRAPRARVLRSCWRRSDIQDSALLHTRLQHGSRGWRSTRLTTAPSSSRRRASRAAAVPAHARLVRIPLTACAASRSCSQSRGYYVLALRLAGSGTLPSELRDVPLAGLVRRGP